MLKENETKNKTVKQEGKGNMRTHTPIHTYPHAQNNITSRSKSVNRNFGISFPSQPFHYHGNTQFPLTHLPQSL